MHSPLTLAALKCRQRKKAWLASLQAKVEFLSQENERLTSALVSSREEISRLSALVGSAGLGAAAAAGVPLNLGVAAAANGINAGVASANGVTKQGVPVSVGVPAAGKGVAAVSAANTGKQTGGYGY